MLKKVRQQLVHVIRSFYCWSSLPTCLHQMLGLIFLGMMSRLVPHPPNFTAINAIALFGICSLGNLGASLFTVFVIMLPCDLVFGLHSSMGFVYLSLGLSILMGYGLKPKRSLIRTTFLLASSSLLFFIITNFGVWLVGSMYPKNVTGLGLCYLAAIPFFANHLMATLLYGGLLFGWCALPERNTPVLLYWQQKNDTA